MRAEQRGGGHARYDLGYDCADGQQGEAGGDLNSLRRSGTCRMPSSVNLVTSLNLCGSNLLVREVMNRQMKRIMRRTKALVLVVFDWGSIC